uniref:Uncharacterized protein n=1 Tax=Anguilla anguilla TaxID=7936 RepID=A0A0E9WI21_ANGAN
MPVLSNQHPHSLDILKSQLGIE